MGKAEPGHQLEASLYILKDKPRCILQLNHALYNTGKTQLESLLQLY